MSLMTVKDLEQVQSTLVNAGLDHRLELQGGEIQIVGSSDIISSEISARLIAILYAWVTPRRLGRIFDSSGGFIMPDRNLKAPDVSFVRASRLKKSVRYFRALLWRISPGFSSRNKVPERSD